jgi:hypothetical protein
MFTEIREALGNNQKKNGDEKQNDGAIYGCAMPLYGIDCLCG